MSRASLPTADELQALTDAFRRDPGSSFVRLGNCLLDLGRPSEAVEVGARGLKAAPSDVEGRLMVGTAFTQMHRWKEAQAELLKVVKADRNNGRGFRLLGEVLMRRNDFERALPVLQHAQNLNPSDSELLALVRRARDGQALEPPPPIPTPRQPAAGTLDDEAPTFVAGQVGAMPGQGALGRVDLQRREVPSRSPAPPVDRVSPGVGLDQRGREEMQFAPVEHRQPPPPEDPLAPLAPPRASRPSAPPPPPPGAPGQAPTIRPRVIPAEKPKDAAQEGLRGSAAVGEEYLNSLLFGGLLEVPNVRVSEANYDAAPGKRWGRSGIRMFIYLFVVLIAAGTGSGVWYWYTEKQMSASIARDLDGAKKLIDGGDREELAAAAEQVRRALDRDKSDVYTMAVLGEIVSLSSLLYGEYTPSEVQPAVDAVANAIKEPGQQGFRELVIARSAMTLSQLQDLSDADSRLAAVRKELEDWLARSPDDQLATWLLGRALLAAGDRKGAFAAFAKAHANGEGVIIATVDLANFHLDEGEHSTAMTLYDQALDRSQNHALAFVGRSLARSESRIEAQEAVADISIGLARAEGPTLIAWKELAMAGAQAALEDYEGFNAALGRATGPVEPRFLVRVGLGRVQQGRIVDAARIRSEIRWFAADPKASPLVAALDSELLLARGLPNVALEMIGDGTDVRSALIRGRALFDLGRIDDALVAFQTALDQAPEDIETRVWVEACRMLAGNDDERRKADEALDSLGRKAKTKTARFVHGTALAAIGKPGLAKDKFEQSVEDISDAYPNALAYRSYLALARLEFAAGASAEALAYLDKAGTHNPGYLPTRDLLGQVLVETDAGRALQNLADVLDAGVASIGAELAYARALVKTGGSQKDAEQAIRRAKERGAGVPGLQKSIQEVNPALFEELDVPAP